MKNILLSLCCTVIFLRPICAQEPIPCAHSCCFNGILPDQKIYGFESDNEAKAAIHAVMRHTGLPTNFVILAGNVPNASAIVHDNTRYIVYNQSFMLAIRDVTRTNWSLLSILIHELGHHLSGHTLDGMGSRPDKELEADRFSGFILYKMGATLEQAKITIDKFISEEGSSTHPPKSARLAAITNGWIAAKELASSSGAKPESEANPNLKKPTGQATADFTEIRVEQNTVQNGQKGLLIRARLETNQLKGQKCLVSAWLYDTYGKPLRDSNQKYATGSGFVAASVSVFPTKDMDALNAVSIFIPYNELHLPQGKQSLKVNLGLHNGTKAIGTGSTYLSFEVE